MYGWIVLPRSSPLRPPVILASRFESMNWQDSAMEVPLLKYRDDTDDDEDHASTSLRRKFLDEQHQRAGD